MADCCIPVVLPTCTPSTCPQFYDACCVIQQDPLICLFDPLVEVAGAGAALIGSTTVVVTNAVGGTIVVGMYAESTLQPGIVPGSIVTAVTPDPAIANKYTVVLDTPVQGIIPGAGSNKVTFTLYRTDVPQCEVNEALTERICDLEAVCSEWTDITNFTDAWDNTDPSGTSLQVAQRSNVQNCSLKLRGSIIGTDLDPDPVTGIVTSTIFTLSPASNRPAKPREFSVNVTEIAGGSDYIVPGIVTVFTTGVVQVTFSMIPSVDLITVRLSLDNIVVQIT